MRIHERGQLFDGIRHIDGRINLDPNPNINEINFINNNIEGNQLMTDNTKRIKIDIKKTEDVSMQNLNFNKKANSYYDDIIMKEGTKTKNSKNKDI